MAFYTRKFRNWMVLSRSLFILFFLVLACSPPSSKEEATGEISGKLIYDYYCVSCHGLKGDQQAGGAPDLTSSTLETNKIREKILFGGNGMTAYNTMIKDQAEIEALVKHVEKLRKN